MDRIDDYRRWLTEADDDGEEAAWSNGDIRHLLSELDAARAGNERLRQWSQELVEWGGRVEAENVKQRRTIGHLVALLKNSSSQDNDMRSLFGMGIARDGLTWADAIGDTE
jgi:hypothetical protein